MDEQTLLAVRDYLRSLPESEIERFVSTQDALGMASGTPQETQPPSAPDPSVAASFASLSGLPDSIAAMSETIEQLANAHRAPDLPSRQAVDIEWENEKRDRRRLKKLFGEDISDEQLMAMANVPAGAKPGAYTMKVFSDNFELGTEVKGDGLYALRSFSRHKGKTVAGNEELRIKDKLEDGSPNPLKGQGYKMLLNQVRALRSAGVDRIETYAAGDAKNSSVWNGYSTWPKLGYGGKMPQYVVDRLPEQLRHSLAGSREIRDLFDLPGGKKAWEEHGDGMGMSFSLADNSRNLQALESYARERLSRGQPAAGTAGTPPSYTVPASGDSQSRGGNRPASVGPPEATVGVAPPAWGGGNQSGGVTSGDGENSLPSITATGSSDDLILPDDFFDDRVHTPAQAMLDVPAQTQQASPDWRGGNQSGGVTSGDGENSLPSITATGSSDDLMLSDDFFDDRAHTPAQVVPDVPAQTQLSSSDWTPPETPAGTKATHLAPEGWEPPSAARQTQLVPDWYTPPAPPERSWTEPQSVQANLARMPDVPTPRPGTKATQLAPGDWESPPAARQTQLMPAAAVPHEDDAPSLPAFENPFASSSDFDDAPSFGSAPFAASSGVGEEFSSLPGESAAEAFAGSGSAGIDLSRVEGLLERLVAAMEGGGGAASAGVAPDGSGPRQYRRSSGLTPVDMEADEGFPAASPAVNVTTLSGSGGAGGRGSMGSRIPTPQSLVSGGQGRPRANAQRSSFMEPNR